MRIWILLGLAACTTADVGERAQSIIGGQTANPADYPTVVALEEAPGNWFCTGTLIANDWVLTAAHCVDPKPATLSVRFDDADVNDLTGGKVVAVKSVHGHPDFNWEAWDNDIALLRLAEPVTDRMPTPIHRDLTAAGLAVTDVGYGVSDNNDGGGGLLREVGKTTADCAGANDPTVSGDVLVCMDASDGRGSCFGDSGGPAFATINNARVVVGVTSGGTGDLCGAGWDLYTSVYAELAFIDMTMSAAPEPDPMPQPEPQPEPVPGDEGTPDDKSDGGCNSSRGNASLLLLGLVAALRRKRSMRGTTQSR